MIFDDLRKLCAANVVIRMEKVISSRPLCLVIFPNDRSAAPEAGGTGGYLPEPRLARPQKNPADEIHCRDII
jgi:hypothetical protein